MAETGGGQRSAGGYVVLRDVGEGRWRVVGESDRRPGLRSDAARLQAVQDVTGGTAGAGEVYAVVLRGEWQLAQRIS